MPWTIDRYRAAVVLIDVQERINGAMLSDAHVARIGALLEAARLGDLPVLATEQYPKGLGPTLPALAALLDNPPVEKTSFSCWREEAFRAAIDDRNNPPQVILCGIEAHVCVLQTALDMARAGHEVFVPHDAVSSRRAADRDWALQRMQQAGIVIGSTESMLFELLERCGTDEFRQVSKLVKAIPV